MKKIIPVLISSVLLFTAAACAPSSAGEGGEGKTETEISLWTYPVGEWGNANSVAPLINAFRRAHPDISIKIKTLNYTTGDREIKQAIREGNAPDLVFEGPERIVVPDAWKEGDAEEAGYRMAPLDDLWEGEVMQTVNLSVEKASRRDGTYYFYPICMSTHCMAINIDLFEAAGAVHYINVKDHTWTTEGFKKAVAAIHDYNVSQGSGNDVAAIYCSAVGGDQGTRALVNNLYGGTFADGTEYSVNSSENIQALELLRSMEGIRFDATINGVQEQESFCRGELAMSFCWNVVAEINQSIAHPDFAASIFPMAFPAEGKPSLQGGIWGFGVFDNGDAARIAAAKEFIRYIGEEDYTRAVTTSFYLPVRELQHDPYENDALMNEYSIFSPYLGDYYQITPNWAEARTGWMNLLQNVGLGADIAQTIGDFPNVQAPPKTTETE